ncbi:MAG: GSCFA domain-containing protein [Janthinobacterium lividum]
MFRTELTIAPQERLLPRTARVLTVGSCFADSIGERLRLDKVQTLVNPFGTVFQPLALAQLLRAATGEEQDWQQHLVEARGRWQSYDFHSTIGADSPVELLRTIQETVRRVGDFVRTADMVVLTLGTAWAYRLRETGELVSNLHKLPATLFEKELLTADEIVNSLAEVHALLRRTNPDIRIVLTVSPVRHIKDTLPLNAVSKSVLRVACHYLSELLPNVSYFPAYELLTDDLRDYRFYAADMLHPSEVAEEYIWERFARTYFDADFGRFRKEWAAVRQSLSHRPLHVGAPEHRIFLDQTRERLERLTSQGVDVRQELRDIQRQLAALPPPRPTRVPEVILDDDEERIDIGNSSATPMEAIAPATERRTEEPQRSDRHQDNRRDGRNRSNRAHRDIQLTPAPLPTTEEVTHVETALEESVAASVEALLSGSETDLPPAEAAGYPAKKKKRRSRGGAKRTARKNAARLVAEQDASELALETEPEAVEDSLLEIVDADNEELVNELVEDIVTPSVEPTPDDVVPNSGQPTRKRGTGPTPKKSKVITKSGLVKRGQRNTLYRTAAPEASEAATPTLTSAPIISSPIIPEILMERPAADLTVPTPPAANLDLAATVLGLFSTKPKAATDALPKRSRPKTASIAPTVIAEAVSTPTEATEPGSTTVDEPAEAPRKPAKAPTKKAATRPAKATKPAATKKTTAATKPVAPKKTVAKPAASRRGRPPGKQTPPPTADEPTS